MGEKPFKNLPDQAEKNEKLVFRAGMSPTESNKKIGPIRSHLYNYAFAKSEAARGKDAKIIFRVDDTDKEKHTKEKAEEILRFFTDILGFHFDITPHNAENEIGQSVFQSERQEIYQKYLEELFDKRIAFVDKKSGLTLFDIKKFLEQYTDILEINDLLKGTIKFQLEENLKNGQHFFPLMRSDKSALYHLASVVDDSTFGVTHVVRGQDKLSIAQFQEMVRVALRLEPKKYLHLPMLLEEDRQMLSGSAKFDAFIKHGIVPHAIISYMISSGYGDPDGLYSSLEQFIDSFDYKKIHKNNGKFNIKKLEDINNKITRKLSPEIYLDSVIIYLAKINEQKLAEKLKNDSALKQIIVSLKRAPDESLSIMKSILTPKHVPIRADLKTATQTVILSLEKNRNTFPSTEETGLSPKNLYDAMRWILVGQYEFPNIRDIFEYLKGNNSLNDRIPHAKKIFDDSI